MALISQSDIEAKLGRSLTADEITDFTSLNNAVQSYIKKMLGTDIESVSASDKYFDGGVQHLRIYPCTNITAVAQVDDDDTVIYTYDTSDYTLDPKNQTVKTQIRHRPSKFVAGMNNIKVTAKWSTYADDDVTNIIKRAILEVLSNELGNTDNVRRMSIEGFSVEYISEESKNALEPVINLFQLII